MQKVIAASKDNEIVEFYKDKIESLNSDKSFLEYNVQQGILTPAKYLESLKAYLKTQLNLMAMLKKDSNLNLPRVA